MKKIILWISSFITLTATLAPSIALPAYAAWRFDTAVNDSVVSVSQNIDLTHNGTQWWVAGLRDFIIDIVKKVITPIVIIIGVLLAILWFYNMFGSTKEDDQKKWFNYILRGVIGIVVMVSANFLADTLVNGGIFTYDASWQLLGTITAQKIYNKLMFPFIKFSMYLVLWVLFVLTLLRTISMVTSPKDDAKQKAMTIIQRNAFGIIVIIFAKNLIETIYGTEAQVTSATATNLGQIGTGILADKQIPYVYTVINYIIGFLGLFILVMIIIQALQLLTNPTDDGVQKKMRKNVIYIIIGLVIIGTAYVVTNFLIVK